MDSTKPNNGCCCTPEVGRGCAFCACDAEPEAVLRDGCFKLHETPWLEGYPEGVPSDIFEVRFKNTRRGFYRNVNDLPLKRGDVVAVEASPGHDIGIVSLTGELALRQMRRTGFVPFNGEFRKIYRKAKPYDIERWQEAIALEHETMIQARQIAADMGLNMKIGDVEYQGDKIKAIFYYIADERVDFRELIKVFAERFRIRIEMKQIGARQEAGRIGGLGACGRELCCASWIAGFSSVTTGAARMQDISLNPQKLAGQCSKLKCCMMYEYDTYVDARKDFPRVREPLQTVDGEFFLLKTDILGGTMTFGTSRDTLANVVTLPVARVKEIIALNRAGTKVERLQDQDVAPAVEEPDYRAEEDSITRFDKARRRKKGRGKEAKAAEKTSGEGAVAAESSEGGQSDERAPREGASREGAPREGAESREGREPRTSGDGRGMREERGNRPARERREGDEKRENRALRGVRGRRADAASEAPAGDAGRGEGSAVQTPNAEAGASAHDNRGRNRRPGRNDRNRGRGGASEGGAQHAEGGARREAVAPEGGEAGGPRRPRRGDGGGRSTGEASGEARQGAGTGAHETK
ncbi:regulatory iron-sulfur-containing complex subunit RicT [uncultured Alistipes sp.]|uniref:regulatory iron-sulfur-containing complex subunit RicT n=1 Tax=uncultured Alistipes sp. TaxID=538949 RepID=UPI002626B0F5|nr:regulatory iron-sulfur-containing complex subunit RicT [uncultured Alistipes sp.]